VSEHGPLPMARFRVSAALRHRQLRPMSHSLYVVQIIAGSLVLDASGFPPDAVGTVGVVQAAVIGGRLELWVPPEIDVILKVTERAYGRVISEVGRDRQHPHVLLSGVVMAGSIRITQRNCAP